jgi:hypothetical protein
VSFRCKEFSSGGGLAASRAPPDHVGKRGKISGFSMNWSMIFFHLRAMVLRHFCNPADSQKGQ